MKKVQNPGHHSHRRHPDGRKCDRNENVSRCFISLFGISLVEDMLKPPRKVSTIVSLRTSRGVVTFIYICPLSACGLKITADLGFLVIIVILFCWDRRRHVSQTPTTQKLPRRKKEQEGASGIPSSVMSIFWWCPISSSSFLGNVEGSRKLLFFFSARTRDDSNFSAFRQRFVGQGIRVSERQCVYTCLSLVLKRIWHLQPCCDPGRERKISRYLILKLWRCHGRESERQRKVVYIFLKAMYRTCGTLLVFHSTFPQMSPHVRLVKRL